MCMHAYMCIHTYMHTCIHTYVHTGMHIHTGDPVGGFYAGGQNGRDRVAGGAAGSDLGQVPLSFLLLSFVYFSYLFIYFILGGAQVTL